MRSLPLAVLAVTLVSCSSKPSTSTAPVVAHPVDYVDPRFGSGGFAYEAGNAFPGAQVPTGLVKLGPDTSGSQYGTLSFLHFDGYWAGDETVNSFTHVHLSGTGATDYGVLGVMPALSLDAAHAKPDGLATMMRKKTEKAVAGGYDVTLTNGITVSLGASAHVGFHRYGFPPSATKGVIVFDLGHHLGSDSIRGAALDLSGADVTGRLHSVGKMTNGFGGEDIFFAARFTKAPTGSQVFTASTPLADGSHAEGTDVGAALTFDVSDGAPVELAVAVSFVSLDGAKANLAAESTTFDAARTNASNAWDAMLLRAQISGGSDDERTLFYSALHHVFVMPGEYSDASGAYLGHDGQPHQADGFRYVADLSLWDTYRTAHPLYALLAPELARDAVRSLFVMAQQGGAFPKWPLARGDSGSMVGASAEVVVADSYLRGVTTFDAEAAYQLLRRAALDPSATARGGRDHVLDYDRVGYVPQDVSNGSASVTCEYAQDDFALGNLAAALGHADDATRLHARATSWRHLYDPASGFLRAKKADGTLAMPSGFDPTVMSEEYIEADAWHTLFCAPHDLDGLTSTLGGTQAFLDRLESFFSSSKTEWESVKSDMLLSSLPRPYYWQANEPDIHAAYLFALAGQPAKTAQWSRWVADTFYAPTPEGLPGNDDGGTMSAWYVFTALGLYPLAGSDVLILGAPRFPKAVLQLNGGTFTIEAPQASPQNLYVQSVRLDGVPLTSAVLRTADLKPNGHLAFELGPAPSTWGTK
jgi:predicted alpha-1,2-mannosidase